MEFKTREDIEAPIDFVYDQMTDFSKFERSIMRRGGDTERLEGDGAAEVGSKWRIKFMMRGSERKVTVEVAEMERPSSMQIDITSKNVDADMKVELVPLSQARTRLNVAFEASAKTIPAKLVFQSIRFAKQRSNAKFKAIVTSFAEVVEASYRG